MTENTKNLPKRRVGRPAKTDEKDAIAIIAKIEDQVQRFNAKCADNLDTLFEVIYNVAIDKQAPRKDKVGAAKYCIEQAVIFLKEGGKATKGDSDKDDEDYDEPKKKETTPSNVISLKARD